jgi:hypothetical protein
VSSGHGWDSKPSRTLVSNSSRTTVLSKVGVNGQMGGREGIFSF